MKIILSAPAVARDTESGGPVTDLAILRELDGAVFTGGSCGDYVDVEFLDLGLRGGIVRCRCSDSDGLQIVTEYSAPQALDDGQLQRLAEDTGGQWSDGIGEGGFEFGTTIGRVAVSAEGDASDLRIEQIDDGMAVSTPSLAAIGARNGDLDGLRRALTSGEDIEARTQGMTPLHWAILYGRVDAAALLLAHGADPNVTDRDGYAPLHLCAIASALDEEGSARIAQLLLEKGAVKEIATPTGDTPRALAEARGRTRLLQMLDSQP